MVMELPYTVPYEEPFWCSRLWPVYRITVTNNHTIWLWRAALSREHLQSKFLRSAMNKLDVQFDKR